MPRYIPPALKAHLQGDATTTTLLIRFDPVTPGFSSYGATLLDRDVVYDDGVSEVRYLAPIGMQPVELVNDGALDAGLDTSEHLLPEYDFPIAEEDILAGVYDYARYTVFLVNYDDLTMGHIVLREGTIGQVTVKDSGLSFVNELRNLAAQLKQSICTKYSKTCRAVEGTMPPGSALPGPQVQFGWCGVDFTPYLKSATVGEVGLENTLTFKIRDEDLDGDWAEDFFAPGRVIFTGGRNAGRTVEIMSNTADGWITLRYETGFAIEPNDTLDYRRGCSFIARDAAKGCMAHAGAAWVLHFDGEPDIPTENATQLMTPGATVGPGAGGNTYEPYGDQQQ